MQDMQQIETEPWREHNHQVKIGKHLKTWKFIFVRVDAIQKPLKQPYKWPYRVVNQTNKHFIHDMKRKRETILVDRIKPTLYDDQQGQENTILAEQLHLFITTKSENNGKQSINHVSSTHSGGAVTALTPSSFWQLKEH